MAARSVSLLAKAAVADAVKGVQISTFGGKSGHHHRGPKQSSITFEEQKPSHEHRRSGRLLREKLFSRLQEKHEIIGEVRGMGLLQSHWSWWKIVNPKNPAVAPQRWAMNGGYTRESHSSRGKAVYTAT